MELGIRVLNRSHVGRLAWGLVLAMGGCGGTVSGSPTPAGDAGSSPFNPPPRADSGAPVMPGVDASLPDVAAPEASPPDTGPSTVYPAPHPPAPQSISYGGPIMQAPTNQSRSLRERCRPERHHTVHGLGRVDPLLAVRGRRVRRWPRKRRCAHRGDGHPAHDNHRSSGRRVDRSQDRSRHASLRLPTRSMSCSSPRRRPSPRVAARAARNSAATTTPRSPAAPPSPTRSCRAAGPSCPD